MFRFASHQALLASFAIAPDHHSQCLWIILCVLAKLTKFKQKTVSCPHPECIKNGEHARKCICTLYLWSMVYIQQLSIQDSLTVQFCWHRASLIFAGASPCLFHHLYYDTHEYMAHVFKSCLTVERCDLPVSRSSGQRMRTGIDEWRKKNISALLMFYKTNFMTPCCFLSPWIWKWNDNTNARTPDTGMCP